MKKFTTYLSIALVALLSISLTSCDEDADVAYALDGAWQGNVYVTSKWDGYTYRASYSEVQFNSGYDSGTGYWVDYYSDAPWDYIANHIRWKVRNGNIYIHFNEENSDVVIYDYHLDDYHFSGSLASNGSDDYISFSLQHISSPNWYSYDYYGSEGWYSDWYDDWYGYGYGYYYGKKATRGGNPEGVVRSFSKP